MYFYPVKKFDDSFYKAHKMTVNAAFNFMYGTESSMGAMDYVLLGIPALLKLLREKARKITILYILAYIISLPFMTLSALIMFLILPVTYSALKIRSKKLMTATANKKFIKATATNSELSTFEKLPKELILKIQYFAGVKSGNKLPVCSRTIFKKTADRRLERLFYYIINCDLRMVKLILDNDPELISRKFAFKSYHPEIFSGLNAYQIALYFDDYTLLHLFDGYLTNTEKHSYIVELGSRAASPSLTDGGDHFSYDAMINHLQDKNHFNQIINPANKTVTWQHIHMKLLQEFDAIFDTMPIIFLKHILDSTCSSPVIMHQSESRTRIFLKSKLIDDLCSVIIDGVPQYYANLFEQKTKNCIDSIIDYKVRATNMRAEYKKRISRLNTEEQQQQNPNRKPVQI